MQEVFKQLRLIAYHTTGDKEKAKDLSQDLAIKILENKDTCERLYYEGKLLNWLYRAARNLHIDEIRKVQSGRTVQVFDYVPVAKEGEEYRQRELEKRFQRLLEIHTDNNTPHFDNGKMFDFLEKYCWYMDVSWVMVYIDCGSYSEIARRFGVSRQQAKVRLDEAKERIKLELEKHPDIDFF